MMQKLYPLIIGELLNTHSDFCVCGRETCQHATCGVPSWRLTYMYIHMGSRFGGPRQNALQTMNEFTLFVDFCLISLSKTCFFDIPAKKL